VHKFDIYLAIFMAWVAEYRVILLPLGISSTPRQRGPQKIGSSFERWSKSDGGGESAHTDGGALAICLQPAVSCPRCQSTLSVIEILRENSLDGFANL
jgi:hypothetical protein